MHISVKLPHCILIIVICSILVPCTLAQSISGQQLSDARNIAVRAMEEDSLPGMAVAVWHKGNIIWSEGLGYADQENEVPVDPESSQFRIGSVSKTLTAVGLMLLHQKGKIDLDTNIRIYVPEFTKKQYPVTTRQVAYHTAGIRHYRGFEFISNVHYPTVKEGLKIFAEDTLLFKPGEKYSYSSYGWNLISAAMETASGQGFVPFMIERVFIPLGMSKTLADDNTVEIPGRVKFYQTQNDSLIVAMPVDNSYKWAGGGFLSTAHDLVKFGAGILRGDLLREETLSESWKSGVLNDGTKTNYGIGWASGKDEAGRDWVGHAGGSVGGSSMFLMYPKEELIVVTLINLSGGPARRIAFDIAEQLLASD